ncbi:MAG: alkaline phosphatase D family protein [Planctomycetes bacterium]|nr:alkaline phosphatase D family protein [Planctomycetota bacterium]
MRPSTVRFCLLFSFALLSSCAKVPPPIDISVDLSALTPDKAARFESDWTTQTDRTWIGPSYWANRLQDWRVRDGRIECIGNRLAWRTLHLLDHQLTDSDTSAELRVRMGLTGQPGDDGALGGFLLGAGAADLDYRAASLVQSAPGPEGGILAGVDHTGRLFLRDFWTQGGGIVLPNCQSMQTLPALKSIDLRVRIQANKNDLSTVNLSVEAFDVGTLDLDIDLEIDEDVEPLARVDAIAIPTSALVGNIALFAHQPSARGEKSKPSFWFSHFRGAGFRLTENSNNQFGPILGAQHTLSRGVLKMTAQLPPLSEEDLSKPVELQLLQSGIWETVETAKIVSPGWTAHFHIDDWDSTQPERYRMRFQWDDKDWAWEGTVRTDPVDEPETVLAALSCNHNNKHGFGRDGYAFSHENLWFPHVDLTDKLERQNPDILFFAGDQIYEGASPTFPDRGQPYLDYHYKWSLWYWAFGDLARDRPCVTIPDDHDVYQGNLWGASGRSAKRDNQGGYVMPADFVRMVERTQTAHLPDPWSTAPLDQGITSYYTDLVYGGVSFAILEDRKFKSGPAGLVEHNGPRPDHITDPKFDPVAADVEGAELLGAEQLRFLKHWASDWSGAEFKATLSASVFAGLATHHGSHQDYLRIDLDSNGWPQSGRNAALREIRRAFAVMIGGDQHLSTVAHHGIDTWEDAGFSFVVPAIANFYARAWRPQGPPIIPLNNAEPLPHTGSYLDGLGNHVTVYAHTNPGPTGQHPAALHDQMPGWGTVRFKKAGRKVTFECWPRWADPVAGPQYTGWPFEIPQLLNGGRRNKAYLPELRISGMRDPVLQVIDSFSDEVIYTYRIQGQRFRAPVPEEGKYDLRIGELGTGREILVEGVRATPHNDKELIVDI